MYFQYNETPTGVVDGQNTVFTVQYEIDKIVAFTIDDVHYTSLSFADKTITLDNAPNAGSKVRVSYFAIIGDANTLQEITDRIYLIMNEKTTSTTFDRTKYVIPVVNEVLGDICKWSLTNILTSRPITGGDLRFVRKQSYFTNVPKATLSADVAVGDTTIQFDTTHFSSEGYIVIEQNVIKYSGKTATEITGCERVSTSHASAKEVRQVFKIPGNATKPFRLFDLNNNQEVLYYDFRDRDISHNTLNFFTVIGDGISNNQNYIFVNNSNENKFVLDYYEQNSTLVNDTDKCSLPENYGVKVVAPIVAGMLLYHSDEPDKGSRILQMGYSELQSMYSWFSNQKKNYRRRVQTAPFKQIRNIKKWR